MASSKSLQDSVSRAPASAHAIESQPAVQSPETNPSRTLPGRGQPFVHDTVDASAAPPRENLFFAPLAPRDRSPPPQTSRAAGSSHWVDAPVDEASTVDNLLIDLLVQQGRMLQLASKVEAILREHHHRKEIRVEPAVFARHKALIESYHALSEETLGHLLALLERVEGQWSNEDFFQIYMLWMWSRWSGTFDFKLVEIGSDRQAADEIQASIHATEAGRLFRVIGQRVEAEAVRRGYKDFEALAHKRPPELEVSRSEGLNEWSWEPSKKARARNLANFMEAQRRLAQEGPSADR